MISLRHFIKHMFTFEHLCWRYKYCLSLIGCWPPLHSKRQLFKRFFVNLCIVTLILIQIFALISSANELDTIIEIMTYLLPLLGMDTPYFAVYLNIEKTLYFYNHSITDWKKLESEEERNIFRKYVKDNTNYVIILSVGYGLIFISLKPIYLDIVSPLNVTRPRQAIIPVEFLFIDKDEYFYLTFFIIFITGFVSGFATVTSLNLLFYGVQHGCALFEYVGYKLEHLIDENEFNQEIPISKIYEKIHQRIINNVNLHKRAFEYVDILNSICGHFFFIAILFEVLIIGVDFFKLKTTRNSNKSNEQLFLLICYIPSNVFVVYITCNMGQKILDTSTDVLEKARMVPWYLLSPKMQKEGILIMIRSMKPCYLTIGKMFVSSHQLFTSIVRTAMSYATMVHSIG
ncbi:odorant receptor 22c-like [Vespula squamosa]|uniref:Odorant receptor n=1 Tax=Vespula squamosa TaxID=30214 RepID=A0ABD2AVF3_VESSQ